MTEKEIRDQIQKLQKQLEEIEVKKTSIGLCDIVRIKNYYELGFAHEYGFIKQILKDEKDGHNIYRIRVGKRYDVYSGIYTDEDGYVTPEYTEKIDEKFNWFCTDADLELICKFSYWNARFIQVWRTFKKYTSEPTLSLNPLGVEVKCVIPFEGEFNFHVPDIQDELNKEK